MLPDVCQIILSSPCSFPPTKKRRQIVRTKKEITEDYQESGGKMRDELFLEILADIRDKTARPRSIGSWQDNLPFYFQESDEDLLSKLDEIAEGQKETLLDLVRRVLKDYLAEREDRLRTDR